MFAEKGYRDASMQEIADRADFAVSTLYALFENKEDLYRQVSVDVGRRAGALFEELMAGGGNAYEKLVIYARAKGAVYRESPAGVRMLEQESHALRSGGEADFPRNGIGRIYERFMRKIEALFAEGIREGWFAGGDPVLMALALDSATNALMLRSLSHPDTCAYDERVEEMIELFFGPVLAKQPGRKPKGR